jgi:hypothetical protein
LCFERVLLSASPELLVAERSPQVPARHGAERAPLLTKAFDITPSSVDICNGPLESDVAQREHVWMPKDHDAEN